MNTGNEVLDITTIIVSALTGGFATKFLLPLITKLFEHKSKEKNQDLNLARGDLEKQNQEYKEMLTDCYEKKEEQNKTIILLTEQYARFKAQVELVEKINSMQKKTIFSQTEDIVAMREKIFELKNRKIDSNGK